MSGMQQSRAGSPKPDWTRTVLSQIGKVVRGASPRPAGDPRYFSGDFMPWLTVAALTNIPDSQLIVVETAGKLTEAGAQFSRTLMAGTVIIANSGATLGVAKVLGVTCCANDGIAALLDLRADVEPRYVVHQINSQTDRLRKVVATGNGQPNLNTGLIGAIEIDLPCRAEQSAISDALDASNALIDSLEQLLTKKRQIKQGAMQELLTGKRRLPGYETPWIRRPFSEVASVSRERVNPSALNTPPLCVELEHLQPGTGRLVGDAFESQQAATKSVFRQGDVLFGKLRAYLRKYWLAEFEGVCSTEIWVLRPRGELASNAYLFYTIQRDDFIDVASNAYGTHMPRSDWKIVSEFSLSLPGDGMEQAAIAQVLFDMDTEISTIESRLTKARALKQAMAQALLTGRIRLVEPTA